MTIIGKLKDCKDSIKRVDYVALEATDRAARNAWYALTREQREGVPFPANKIVMRRGTYAAIRTDANHAGWRLING
jgi:hypothetical protein